MNLTEVNRNDHKEKGKQELNADNHIYNKLRIKAKSKFRTQEIQQSPNLRETKHRTVGKRPRTLTELVCGSVCMFDKDCKSKFICRAVVKCQASSFFMT